MTEERVLKIMPRVCEHYEEALKYFPEDRIVGIFLQGSQNYNLDTPESDVDTKLIVVPTFKDIAMNHKPISTTHVRENEEHIDFKDVRLYMQTFRKQNLNFLEILFTDFAIVNPKYKSYWEVLKHYREEITHYHHDRGLKSMKGIAMEKYHALKHPYPSKLELLEKYGYDGKQLHHLVRIEEFINRFLDGEPYADCLITKQPNYLKALKANMLPLAHAEELAAATIENVVTMVDCALNGEPADERMDMLLDEIQYQIMEEAIRSELK